MSQIQKPPQGYSLFSTDAAANPFKGYAVKVRYYYDSGIHAAPVAGPSLPGVGGSGGGGALAQRQPCSILQLSAPHGLMIVAFAGERVGDWPTIPDPEAINNDNQVYKHGWMDMEDPTLDPGSNSKTYKVSGEFVYILKRPVWFKDGLRTPASPYGQQGPGTLDPSKFKPLL